MLQPVSHRPARTGFSPDQNMRKPPLPTTRHPRAGEDPESQGICFVTLDPRLRGDYDLRVGPKYQAEATTPLSASNCASSPLSYISIMMSDPPTNSPFT